MRLRDLETGVQVQNNILWYCSLKSNPQQLSREFIALIENVNFKDKVIYM